MSKLRPFKDHTPEDKGKILGLSLVCMLCWSTPHTATALALRSFSPSVLTFLRYFSASLIFLIIALFIRMPLPALKDVPEIVGYALFDFVLYNITIAHAQQTLPAGMISVLLAFVPILVAFLAAWILHEKMPRNSWIGLFVACAGVIWIVAGDGFGKLEPGLGYLWMLGPVVGSAVAIIIHKHLLEKYSPFSMMAYAIWAATLMMTYSAPQAVRELGTASAESILAIVYLGTIPTVLAFTLFGIVLKMIPAGEAEVLLYPDTPLGILFSAAVLHERPQLTVWLGLALIFLGIYITGRKKKEAVGSSQ